jgi:hypothetical protein
VGPACEQLLPLFPGHSRSLGSRLESIERIARRTYFGTKIEHDLESSGVALFAADEPIVLNGKRATTILTRRVKQGVADWYVLELLEKSWDGFCEHTRQGWNVGSATLRLPCCRPSPHRIRPPPCPSRRGVVRRDERWRAGLRSPRGSLPIPSTAASRTEAVARARELLIP